MAEPELEQESPRSPSLPERVGSGDQGQSNRQSPHGAVTGTRETVALDVDVGGVGSTASTTTTTGGNGDEIGRRNSHFHTLSAGNLIHNHHPDSHQHEVAYETNNVEEEPSLEPYVGKLERYELFSTNQCYYLVGCNKLNTAYRVLKLDRTLIERPPVRSHPPPQQREQPQPNQPPLAHAAAVANTHHTLGNSSLEGPGGDIEIFLTPSSTGLGGPISHGLNETASDLYDVTTSNATDGTTAAASDPSSDVENNHQAKPTLRPLSEFLVEDPNIYTQEEIKDMLDMIHDGNLAPSLRQPRRQGAGNSNDLGTPVPSSSPRYNRGGGLKPIVKAYGIVGFVRFLDCYYLTLITRRAKVGSLGGNAIYTIKNTETVPLKPAERPATASGAFGSDGSGNGADPSSVLLSFWNRGKRQIGLGLTNRELAELRYQGLYQVVDLTKNFYFSYTYDLTRTLQENFLMTTTRPFPPPPFKDMFAWNFFLTREFESCLTSMTTYHWIMPITHGAFIQKKVSDYGLSLNLSLIARRSRHFAGTRYLKRGVSEYGKVANYVEFEQILHDESKSASTGCYSSFLQVRGSIPTFWTQESSIAMPKPPIELNRRDPTYQSTKRHFEDLFKLYASPVVVLDLVKQSEKREREVLVGNEYRHAIEFINDTIDDQHKIRYCALDYSHISKHRNLDVSSSLNEVSTWAVNQTGFFCSAPRWKIINNHLEPFTIDDYVASRSITVHLGVKVFPMEQQGVLRVNCVDCIDRTNVAQFSAGVEAIAQQLVVMGIRSVAKLDPSSTIVRVLIDMYVDVGDSIALQYGGSEAHKKMSTENSESNVAGPIGKHKELLTSIRRYYSNAFTDRLKQDAMNLFLGYYVPSRHTIPLWELETDYYLHNARTGLNNVSLKAYERAFGIDITPGAVDDGDKQCRAISAMSVDSRGRSNYTDEKGTYECAENDAVKRIRMLCKIQDQQLSSWWMMALHFYVQQRMWMRLGNFEHDELYLPSRFDRLYQPEKIAQFDRFFARGWAAPVRRSHAAQHAESTEQDEMQHYLRRIVTRDYDSAHELGEPPRSPNDNTELHDFFHCNGFELGRQSELQRFAKFYEIEPRSKVTYAGEMDLDHVPKEYELYVQPSQKGYCPLYTHKMNVEEEFKQCLNEYTLDSNDVDGIRALVISAHIDQTIYSGQYRGLSKNRSAIEVATAIHEQFIVLESMGTGATSLVQNELRRRRLDTPGVQEAVTAGWDSSRRKEYVELVDGVVRASQRSDMTNTGSLQLYASVFDASTPLSNLDKMYLLQVAARKGSFQSKDYTSVGQSSSDPPISFVKKAARLGIPIIPRKDILRSRVKPLFEEVSWHSVPEAFEQINEDLFARRDNKFAVFNGVAMRSWSTAPSTKVSSIEVLLRSTV